MRNFWLAILSLGVVLFGGAAAYGEPIELSPAQRKSLGVETAIIKAADAAPERHQYTGTVMIPPGHGVPASSPLDAVLIELFALPGMRVEAGQPVGRLYSPSFETVKADLEAKRLTAAHKRGLAQRAEELRALGLRSNAEVDEAFHEAETADLDYHASRRRISAVQSTGTSSHFLIVAPKAGIVSHVTSEAGASVGMGEPIVTLFDGERYWLRVPVAEVEATRLEIDQAVTLPQTKAAGRIASVDPETDPASRSVDVLVELPTAGRWRIGQLVDVIFTAGRTVEAVSLPTRAIVRIGEQTFVFADRGDGIHQVAVDVISQDRTRALVQGPLSPGETVVVAGLAALKNLVEAS